MSSTGDVFLEVSAQAPEPANPNTGKRLLSTLTPVIEDDDEPETDEKGADISEVPHPDFVFDDNEVKQVFLTASQQVEYISPDEDIERPSSANIGEDVVDGLTMSERLNSDGEHFDELYSDSNSSDESDTESKDDDYETDLDYDEESK